MPATRESDTPPPTAPESTPAELSGERVEAATSAPAAGRLQVVRVLKRLRREALPTARYLTETEVHTYAFSVAANAILSFFPFCVLLLTLVRRVFHSPAMSDAVVQLLSAFLPANQPYITRNLTALASARRGVQILSVVMLLITSTGVFLPLEVALNRVWGFAKNRSYLSNQLISLALAAACGLLALISAALTASNQHLLTLVFGADSTTIIGKIMMYIQAVIALVVVKVLASLATIGIFFLIYWRLPNGKVKARRVLPAAVVTGIIWEIAKHIYVLALPWLNFPEAYGPFYISVTLIFWAFLSGLLLLAGARLSVSLRIDEPAPSSDFSAADGI